MICLEKLKASNECRKSINFHYPGNLLDFIILIETFQQETLNKETENDESNCNIFEGNRSFEKLSLWMASQVLQTSRISSVVLWQSLKNSATPVFISSTSSICQNQFGK